MEPSDRTSFQLLKNNFQNINSEFSSHTTLKTTAYLSPPNFAKISVTRDTVDTKIVAVKTSKSIMQAFYKNSDFQTTRKLNINDQTLERQIITTVDFNRHVFNPEDPPYLIVGYESGLLSYIDCTDGKLVGLYNCDEKRKSIYKNRSVSLVTVLPYLGEPEIIAMFEDSTAMRYRLNTQSQNMLFVEKISKFEAKISFNKSVNKFKQKAKTKNSFTFGSYLNDAKHEFNHFYAINRDHAGHNPAGYYKFNHRTISDFTVKRHQSFSKTILKNSYKEEMAVMAMTSLDGYLVLYELTKMKPLLSYKAEFGGINSVSFSENCELIAMSGQDDCITVLDLYTLTTIKCIGHKSFVSRAIFQPMPMSLPLINSQSASEEDNSQNTNTNAVSGKEKDKKKKKSRDFSPRKGHKEDRNNMWTRIIAGGIDAIMSFWELNTEIFGNIHAKIEENKLPLKLNHENTKEINTIEPIHLEQMTDAVGWIEMCDNMLVECGYDGAVTTYLAKDILIENKDKDKGEEDKDKESMTTKATEKEKEERSPIKHSNETKEDEEEETKEMRYRLEDIILTRHESNTDFKFEQQEYTEDDETVSKSMLYFEGMGGRSNRKTPSWSFTSSKMNSSNVSHSNAERKEKS